MDVYRDDNVGVCINRRYTGDPYTDILCMVTIIVPTFLEDEIEFWFSLASASL